MKYDVKAEACLANARLALERAEKAYHSCRFPHFADGIQTDDGCGFEVLDNLDTTVRELELFADVADVTPEDVFGKQEGN